MNKSFSLFLFLFVFSGCAFAQSTQNAIPTQIKDVKVEAFSASATASTGTIQDDIGNEIGELSMRVDASIFRATTISSKMVSRADVFKTRGIKNSKMNRTLTSITAQIDMLKQEYADWKTLKNTFAASENQSKDYTTFRTKTVKLLNNLNKLTTLQKSIIGIYLTYDKPSPTPKPSPTLRPSPTSRISVTTR